MYIILRSTNVCHMCFSTDYITPGSERRWRGPLDDSDSGSGEDEGIIITLIMPIMMTTMITRMVMILVIMITPAANHVIIIINTNM